MSNNHFKSHIQVQREYTVAKPPRGAPLWTIPLFICIGAALAVLTANLY